MVSLNGDKHPVSMKSVLQKKTDILLLIPTLTLGVLLEQFKNLKIQTLTGLNILEPADWMYNLNLNCHFSLNFKNLTKIKQ